MAFGPAQGRNSSLGFFGQVRTLSVYRKFVLDSKISRVMCASLVVGTLPSLPGSVAVTAALASTLV
jgi:hypothetical protein